MSVSGLLSCPVAFLVDSYNLPGIIVSLETLHKNGFYGTIYIWRHYLNENEKTFLQQQAAKYTSKAIFREAGTEMVYGVLCDGERINTLDVSLGMLAWEINEDGVLVVGPDITSKCWNSMRHLQHVEDEIQLVRARPWQGIFSNFILQSSYVYLPLKVLKNKYQPEDLIRIIKQSIKQMYG